MSTSQCSNKNYKKEGKRQYEVIVTPDNEEEKFTPSECNCDMCRSMHNAQLEWDTFIPTTELQFRMKEVVNKLENNKIKKLKKRSKKKKN